MDQDLELATLREQLAESEKRVERLLLRVSAKDKEFGLERAAWKREKKKLEGTITALQQDLNRGTR